MTSAFVQRIAVLVLVGCVGLGVSHILHLNAWETGLSLYTIGIITRTTFDAG